MKIQIEQQDIERTNIGAGSKFSIEDSAHMLDMLSNLLYSNKIEAVIREVSCNAHDSHISANIPNRKIDVHLPDVFDSSFWVRDYGISMDEDTVRNLYTTMGKSNKTKDNKLTGGFGLGSKSPFAYVDSFSVDTFLNGVHKSFVAFKNEKREGEIVLMNTQDTLEPNGVKVSVPVKEPDFYNFAQTAHKVFSVFSIYPNVIGNTKFKKPEDPNIILTGKNWKLVNSNSPAKIIMGNVAYPISSEYTPPYSNGLILYADIGDFRMAPSREALSYDEKGIALLKERVKELKSDLTNLVNNELKKCKTAWDAKVYFYNNFYYASFISQNIDINFLVFKRKPLNIKTNVLEVESKKWLPLLLKVETKNYSKHKIQYSHRMDLIKIELKPTVFFLNKEKAIGTRKINQYIENNKDFNFLTISPMHEKNFNEMYNEFTNTIGNPKVINTQDLPKVKIIPKYKKEKVNKILENGVYTISRNGLVGTSLSTEEEDIFYVFSNNRNIIDPQGKSIYIRSFDDLIASTGIVSNSNKILAISIAHKKVVSSKKSWKNIFTLIDEYYDLKLKEFEKDKDLFEESLKLINEHPWIDSLFNKICNNFEMIKTISSETKNQEFKNFVTDITPMIEIINKQNITENKSFIKKYLENNQYFKSQDRSSYDLKVLSIFEKFPMLEFVFPINRYSSLSNENYKTIVSYLDTF